MICFGIAVVFISQGKLMQAQKDSSQLKEIAKPVNENLDSLIKQMDIVVDPAKLTEKDMVPKQQNDSKDLKTLTTQPSTQTTSQPTTQTSTNVNESALIVEVYDRNTRQLIDGVEVYLFSRVDKSYIETKVTQNGTVSFIIENKKLYEIRTCKNGYLKKSMAVTECDRPDKLFCLSGVFEFYVGPPHTLAGQVLAKIAVDPIAVGQTIELENVYYDLGKSTLRPDSKRELNKVYDLLKQYKTLVIELSSHTDSRGGNDFNMKLSSNRAKSCFNYLVGKGIEAKRIQYKGYGETVLLNECADGVSCSESQHQKNRRTEISILEIEEEPCEPSL